MSRREIFVLGILIFILGVAAFCVVTWGYVMPTLQLKKAFREFSYIVMFLGALLAVPAGIVILVGRVRGREVELP